MIKKFWFIAGLLLVFGLTVADPTNLISDVGIWLKTHHWPDAVIIFIFFFSGLMLNAGQIKSGMTDIKGILVAIIIIFIVAPILAALFCLSPLNLELKTGIFLVAIMPTTLSSGVVMTGVAGGNIAHALLITILSSCIAVFTIPAILSLFVKMIGEVTPVTIDKSAIMIKIALLVLAPLCAGLFLKYYVKSIIEKFDMKLSVINQLLVLSMVWMAISQAKQTIICGEKIIGLIFILVFVFHGTLLLAAGMLIRFFRLGRGRRESVIIMGCQKTLPLSVILQVTLFPQYGYALVVCVAHHVIHLAMDSYLTKVLKTRN